MKKSILLLAFLIGGWGATYAQKGKVSSAKTLKDNGKIGKALETINSTIDPSNPKSEKTIDWPRTWEVRGEIYRAAFLSKDTTVADTIANPLQTSLSSFKKALKLDTKGHNQMTVKMNLTQLITDFTNQAVKAFNKNDYNMALSSFENIMDIEHMPLMQEKDQKASVDTVIIFNAALAAYNAKKYDDAIKYYKEAANYNYNGARTYQLLASCYINKTDTIGALTVLKEGFQKYPENSQLIVQMINIYLQTNKVNDALKYLHMAIDKDPSNSSYYFALGSTYEKLDSISNAIDAYEQSIKLKDDNFNAYYNLGAIYYNKGVKQLDVANAVPTSQEKKYEEEKAKADDVFKKAIPYMEKAAQINPEDVSTLQSLKTLYYRLKMMDKFKEVNQKLQDLQGTSQK